jgi:hypothetical protein
VVFTKVKFEVGVRGVELLSNKLIDIGKGRGKFFASYAEDRDYRE